jgi:tetratricopeptide (TPR) repeat protein
MRACDCLKWKYKGNGHLEAGKVALAIDAYDNALATNVSQQEGIILLMRATAYLQRAGTHKKQLKEIVNELIAMVPDMRILQSMYDEASSQPAIANSVFRRIIDDTMTQEKQFRRTQYRHGLYQYALLQAAQDSLRATQLMPNYATSWLRAGEILSELWKLKESAQYYERAIELDASLSDSLVPVINRLRKRQELLDNARAYGWSEDTLRLALDMAG